MERAAYPLVRHVDTKFFGDSLHECTLDAELTCDGRHATTDRTRILRFRLPVMLGGDITGQIVARNPSFSDAVRV